MPQRREQKRDKRYFGPFKRAKLTVGDIDVLSLKCLYSLRSSSSSFSS